jgi:hypothetical protein
MDRGATWLDLTARRLSLIYVPTEANIPILEAGRIFEIILKGGRYRGMPLDRTVTVAPISALSMNVCILFPNFFRPKISARSVSVFFKISRVVGRQGGGGDAKKVGRLRIIRAGVLGAWSPSLLWRESITTPFGFLGAIVVQRLKRQFRM